MTPQTSDEIRNLVGTFLHNLGFRIEAIRMQDVPKANRYLLKAAEAADRLSDTPAGKRALEDLLIHPDLNVRIGAAERVIRWDPDRVIPIFGRVLDADLSHIDSIDERLDLRHRARAWLQRQFNATDRNDLVEPLKAYGVKLKRREYPD